jgi:hypothetical protein
VYDEYQLCSLINISRISLAGLVVGRIYVVEAPCVELFMNKSSVDIVSGFFDDRLGFMLSVCSHVELDPNGINVAVDSLSIRFVEKSFE